MGEGAIVTVRKGVILYNTLDDHVTTTNYEYLIPSSSRLCAKIVIHVLPHLSLKVIFI